MQKVLILRLQSGTVIQAYVNKRVLNKWDTKMGTENGILEIVVALFFNPLGRLIFGKKFNTVYVEPFWKRFFLGTLIVVFAWILLTAVVLTISSMSKP